MRPYYCIDIYVFKVINYTLIHTRFFHLTLHVWTLFSVNHPDPGLGLALFKARLACFSAMGLFWAWSPCFWPSLWHWPSFRAALYEHSKYASIWSTLINLIKLFKLNNIKLRVRLICHMYSFHLETKKETEASKTQYKTKVYKTPPFF